MIKVINQTLKRDKFEIRDMNFEIEKGKVTALVGKNNAGKSSLMYGLIGSIPLETNKEAFTSAFVGNNMPFNPHITVSEVPNLMQNIHPNFSRDAYFNYCRTFNLEIYSKLIILSKGQIKYVMLACALSLDPDVLFLDEIMLNIDQFKKENFKSVIEDFMKKGDKTVVLATNQIEFFEDVIDNLIYIKNNHIYYAGSLLNLKSNLKIVNTDEVKDEPILYETKSAFSSEALIQTKHGDEENLVMLLKYLERSSNEKLYF